MTRSWSHTPGPWKFMHDGDPVQVGDSKGRFVAMTLPCESDGATIEDIENARLIAAAPETKEQRDELLAAARVMLKLADGEKLDEPFSGEVEQLRAAISKATKEITR